MILIHKVKLMLYLEFLYPNFIYALTKHKVDTLICNTNLGYMFVKVAGNRLFSVFDLFQKF